MRVPQRGTNEAVYDDPPGHARGVDREKKILKGAGGASSLVESGGPCACCSGPNFEYAWSMCSCSGRRWRWRRAAADVGVSIGGEANTGKRSPGGASARVGSGMVSGCTDAAIGPGRVSSQRMGGRRWWRGGSGGDQPRWGPEAIGWRQAPEVLPDGWRHPH